MTNSKQGLPTHDLKLQALSVLYNCSKEKPSTFRISPEKSISLTPEQVASQAIKIMHSILHSEVLNATAKGGLFIPFGAKGSNANAYVFSNFTRDLLSSFPLLGFKNIRRGRIFDLCEHNGEPFRVDGYYRMQKGGIQYFSLSPSDTRILMEEMLKNSPSLATDESFMRKKESLPKRDMEALREAHRRQRSRVEELERRRELYKKIEESAKRQEEEEEKAKKALKEQEQETDTKGEEIEKVPATATEQPLVNPRIRKMQFSPRANHKRSRSETMQSVDMDKLKSTFAASLATLEAESASASHKQQVEKPKTYLDKIKYSPGHRRSYSDPATCRDEVRAAMPEPLPWVR